MARARVFMSGRSQAIRLPARLRLSSKDVTIEPIVESWLSCFSVQPWPLEATHHYAAMRTTLERAGTPVETMDLLIAAHAAAEDSVVVTNNASEFLRIPGIPVEEWAFR